MPPDERWQAMAQSRRKRRRDEQKELFWRGVISEWRGSGQRIRQFCRERDLSEGLFYSWRRELIRRDQALRPAAERRRPRPAARPFVEVCVPATLAGAVYEVVCCSGRIVRVSGLFDAQVVSQLVSVVESAGAAGSATPSKSGSATC